MEKTTGELAKRRLHSQTSDWLEFARERLSRDCSLLAVDPRLSGCSVRLRFRSDASLCKVNYGDGDGNDNDKHDKLFCERLMMAAVLVARARSAVAMNISMNAIFVSAASSARARLRGHQLMLGDSRTAYCWLIARARRQLAAGKSQTHTGGD